jgi:hypothetical protein
MTTGRTGKTDSDDGSCRRALNESAWVTGPVQVLSQVGRAFRHVSAVVFASLDSLTFLAVASASLTSYRLVLIRFDGWIH